MKEYIFSEEEIGKLDAMIQEIPFKMAFPILSYIKQVIKDREELRLNEERKLQFIEAEKAKVGGLPVPDFVNEIVPE